MIDFAKEDERIDDLQCKGYQILQKPKGFCFGVDAVLLSHFARVKKDQSVLDLCTGSGVIPILMAANTDGKAFCGLELQEEYADMAGRSVQMNGLQDRVRIICGDVKNIRELFQPASFPVVTVNPPYMTDHHGLQNLYEPKNIARHEVMLSLEDVIAAAGYVLPESGNFYMIHKPFRLAEIFQMMKKYRIEPKRMRLVQPYKGKEPTMVLIEGLKGGRQRITIEPTLIMYESPGVYTEDIYEIYGKNGNV